MGETSKVELQVSGMTCQGCVNSVTRVIHKADPRARVSIDLSSGRVEAVTSASAEHLAQAISTAGYDARVG